MSILENNQPPKHFTYKQIQTAFDKETGLFKEKIFPEIERLQGIQQQHEQQIEKGSLLSAASELPKSFGKLLSSTMGNRARLFSHIHLDHIALNTGYEGLNHSTTVEFLKEMVTNLNENTLIPLFEKLHTYCKDLFAISTAEPPKEIRYNLQRKQEFYDNLKTTKLVPLINKTYNDIQTLASGDCFIMPGGWVGDPGHAMYYVFKKLDNGKYDIFQYNTQQSTEQGGVIGCDKTQVIPCKYFPDVDPKDIHQQFVENLILLNISWLKDDNYKYSHKDVDSAFHHIGNLQKTAPQYLNKFVTTQRSGSCAWNSLAALLLGILSSDPNKTSPQATEYYKYLIFESKLTSLIAEYDSFKDDVTSGTDAIKFQLNKAAENFCRRIGKFSHAPNQNVTSERAKAALYTALDMQNKLKPKKETGEEYIDISENVDIEIPPDKIDALDSSIETVLGNIPHANTIQNLSTQPFPHLTGDQTDIHQVLADLEKHLSLMVESKNSDVDQMTLIEAFVENLPIPSKESQVWKNISHEQAVVMLDQLQRISASYSTLILKNSSQGFPKTQNTHMTILAISFEFAKYVDSKQILNEFSLFSDHYVNLLKNDSYYLIEDTTEFERRIALIEYFQNQPNNSEKLFNFERLLRFDDGINDIADVKLYRRIIHSNSEIQRKLEEQFQNSPNLGCSNEVKQQLPLFKDFGEGESILAKDFNYIVILKKMMLNSFLLMGKGALSDEREIRMQIDQFGNSSSFYCSNSSWKPFEASKNAGEYLVSQRIINSLGRYYEWNKRNAPISENEHQVLLQDRQFSEEEQLALRSLTDGGMQCPALFYFLKHHLDFIETETGRSIILRALFHPRTGDGGEELPLFKELDTNQTSFWHMCKEVIQEGIQQYYLIQPGRKPKIHECLFFIRLAQRLTESYIKINNKKPPFDLLKITDGEQDLDANQLIVKWFSQLPEKDRGMLHLHTLRNYMTNNPSEFSDEDWKVIYKNWVAFQVYRLAFNVQWEDTHYVLQVERWMNRIMPHLQHKLTSSPELASKIGDDILRSEIPEVESSIHHWNFDKFPVLRTADIKHGFWEINLNTGKIQNQEGVIRYGSLEPRESDYKRLFEERTQTVRYHGANICFHDKIYGPVQIKGGDFKNGIQREIKGETYQYVPYDDIALNKLPSALIQDYSHWTPTDGNKIKLIFTNRKTGETVATWYKGNPDYILMHDRKLANLHIDLNKPYLLCLNDFEHQDHILHLLINGRREKIQFPRYLSENGTILAFQKRDKRWNYTHDKNFDLFSKHSDKPLGDFDNYLCLKHTTKENVYKFLVPKLTFNQSEGYQSIVSLKSPELRGNDFQTGSQRYYEFSYRNNKLISESIEGKLFLAQLFLMQKDYAKAHAYLIEITNSDKELTQESIKLLKEIMMSGPLAHDFSADAAAIKLYAYYILKQRKRFEIGLEAIARPMESTPHPTITDVYATYTEGLNNVNSKIKISPQVELDIIDWAKIKTKRNELLRGDQVKQEFLEIDTIVSSDCNWDKLPLMQLPDFCYIKYNAFLYKKYNGRKVLENSSIRSNKPYPQERFVYDFATLRNGSAKDKQELIYQLKTLSESSETLSFLHFAYKYGTQTPSPDEFLEMDIYDSKLQKSIDDWKAKVIEAYQKFPQAKKEDNVSLLPTHQAKFKSPNLTRDLKVESPFQHIPGKLPSHASDEELRLHYRHVKLDTLALSPEDLTIKNRKLDPKKEETEDEIIDCFNQIIQKYEVGKNLDIQRTYKFGNLKLDENDLKPEELDFAEVIKSDSIGYEIELQKGVDKNNNEKRRRFILKNRKDLEDLYHDLKLAIHKTDELFKGYEKLIKELLNQKPIEEAARLQELALEGGLVTHKITTLPNECLKAIMAPTREEKLEILKKFNPHLNEKDCDLLIAVITNYLTKATLLQQLQRAEKPLANMMSDKNKFESLEKSEMRIYWQQACEALSAKRTYDPKENPSALVLEYLSELRIRPDQAELIKKVVEWIFTGKGAHPSAVFQLMMGGGKTSVILSHLLEIISDKGKVPLFLCHHSQYHSAFGNLKEYQKKRFDKELTPLTISQDELLKEEVIKNLKQEFLDAKTKKNPLIMRTTMLQILQLEFLSVGNELRKNAAEGKFIARLQSLGDILDFCRKECVGIFDEVDLNLGIMLGVHFPKGALKSVEPERIMLVKKIYEILGQDELDQVTGLKVNRQADLSPGDYFGKILPKLAAYLSKDSTLKLNTEALQRSFVKYVSGKLTTEQEAAAFAEIRAGREVKRPTEQQEDIEFLKYLHHTLINSTNESDRKAANLIALAKQLLFQVMPITLRKRENRAYGRIQKLDQTPQREVKNEVVREVKRDEREVKVETQTTADQIDMNNIPGKVVPYLGVGKASNTEFGYIYEQLCYGFQTALSKGISKDQILWYGKLMNKAVKQNARNENGFENTAEAIQFFKMTGISLAQIEDDATLDQAFKNLSTSFERRLDFEAEMSKYTVYYHPQILSSSSLDVVDQVDRAVADSGTLWNVSSLELDLQTNIIPDDGTEGQIMDELIARGTDKSIHTIKNDDIESILNCILTHPKKEKIQGLVDVGGLLTGYDNLEVAQKILDFYEKQNGTLKPIKGVLFFYQDPQTETESFALLKRGEKPIFLKNTTLEEITNHGLSIDEMFTLYDELRITGTDIPQPPEAINLVTIDPQNVLIRSILQGVLRLRQFFQGQDVDFIALESATSALIGGGKTIEGMLKTAIKNQAIQKAKQTYRSFVEHVNKFTRSTVISLLLDNRHNIPKFIKLFDQFAEFIFTDFEDSPYEQYSLLEKEESTLKILKNLIDKRLSRLSIVMKQEFDKEFKIIEANFAKLLAKAEESLQPCPLAMEEHSLHQHKPISLPSKVKESPTTNSKESGVANRMEANIEISKDRRQEVSQNNEKDIEHEQERDIERELKKYQNNKAFGAREENGWKYENDLLDDLQIETKHQWFEKSKIEKFNDVIYHLVFTKDNQDNFDSCFPDNIFVTPNFRLSTYDSLSPFHPTQKPCEQIVIRRGVDGKLQFIMVSMKEASFFRDWISKMHPKNVWLVNPDGKLIESSGQPFPDENDDLFYEQLNEGLWYINFFEGNTDNLLKNPNMTENIFLERNTKKMQDYLKLKTFRRPTQRRLFWSNHIFHPGDQSFEKKKTFGMCEERRAREEKQRLKISQYRPEQIADLDPILVPYITKDQVKHLTKESQFKKLRPNLVEFVPPNLVNLLPDSKVPLLKKREQLQAVIKPEKIRCISDATYLLLTQIPHINQNLVPLVFDSRCIQRFSKDQLKYITKDQLFSLLDTQINEMADDIIMPLLDRVDILRVDALPGLLVAKLRDPDMIAYIIEKAAYVTEEQRKILAAQGDKIHNAAFKLIPNLVGPIKEPQFLKFCSRKQISELRDPTLIQALTEEWQFTCLDDDMLKLLSDTQLKSIRSRDLFNRLDPHQKAKADIALKISALSTDDISKLSPDTDKEIIQNLKVNEFSNLKTKEQVVLLVEKQIKELKYNKHKVIIEMLEGEQISHLPSLFEAELLTPDQISALSPTRDAKIIGWLNSKQIPHLKTKEQVALVHKQSLASVNPVNTHIFKLVGDMEPKEPVRDIKTEPPIRDNKTEVTEPPIRDKTKVTPPPILKEPDRDNKTDVTTPLNVLETPHTQEKPNTQTTTPTDVTVNEENRPNRKEPNKVDIDRKITPIKTSELSKEAKNWMRLKGFGLTMVSPLIFTAALIYHATLLILRGCVVLGTRGSHQQLKLLKMRTRKLVAGCALPFIRAVQIFNPEKFLQIEAKLNNWVAEEK